MIEVETVTVLSSVLAAAVGHDFKQRAGQAVTVGNTKVPQCSSLWTCLLS